MIVACPNCSTKYKLPDEQVRPGAKARCSVCSEVFSIEPDYNTPPPKKQADNNLEDLLFGEDNSKEPQVPVSDQTNSEKEIEQKQPTGSAIDELDNELDDLFGESKSPNQPVSAQNSTPSPTQSSAQNNVIDDNELDALVNQPKNQEVTPPQKPSTMADDPFSHLVDDSGTDFGDLFDEIDPNSSKKNPPILHAPEQQSEMLEQQKASERLANRAFKMSAQNLEAENTRANRKSANDLDFDLNEEEAPLIYGEPAAGSKGNTKLSTKNDYQPPSQNAEPIPPLAQKKEIPWGKIGAFAMILIVCIGIGGYFWYREQQRAAYEAALAEQRERLKLFEVKIEHQFVVANEKNVPPQTKIGNSGAASSTVKGKIFVVTGTVTNNFPMPKSDIRLVASLLDAEGRVLAKKEQFAGTTATMFQLSVMDEKDLEAYLNSTATILENNSVVLPNTSIPFTFVFYRVFDRAATIQVNVISANDARILKDNNAMDGKNIKKQ
ncbi:DUF3426 domain-containing protein [Desulfovibrio litoralis]|uniref:MJ0042 family finger-like domain-containing protein n=1 Tax=Desulfovibrio litoralis DSM 11393 TaxID=1121455 RepID=A0A1M7TBK5_9BACT|nr:DUF3426 domain-containing protein [Desulfovibrio litoralis]SHN68061.1 MJ0042 family finger-like domain-containing protein [Desulfovibrio litoralis DSM 11393]